MKTTSKLLFNEEPITINRAAARVLGLNEAIVVQQVHYWLDINRKAKNNFYDGRTWTFNTYEQWQQDNFDFWSTRTVKRIFTSLFDKGILLKGNYNKKKYDKTLWISLDYDKLDAILEDYQKAVNVEIPTECQNVTTVETLEFEHSDKLSPSIVTDCHQPKGQNGTTYTKDYTKTSSEITTQSEDKPLVVDTNKELIESKTHLLLDSKNKRDKAAKWNKDRLLKAIDIFIEQDGQYFSLLEKIYKDDKNYAPKKASNSKGSSVKTKFHNINQTFTKYTADELEKKLLDQQDKFNKSFVPQSEDKLKALREKQAAKKAEVEVNEIPAEEVIVNDELVNECKMYPEYFYSLSDDTKNAVRLYMKNKGALFIPMHMQ